MSITATPDQLAALAAIRLPGPRDEPVELCNDTTREHDWITLITDTDGGPPVRLWIREDGKVRLDRMGRGRKPGRVYDCTPMTDADRLRALYTRERRESIRRLRDTALTVIQRYAQQPGAPPLATRDIARAVAWNRGGPADLLDIALDQLVHRGAAHRLPAAGWRPGRNSDPATAR